MNDEDFANLVESIKQAGQIKKGVLEPSRIFEFNPLDIKAIGKKFHQSQQEFALMIGVSSSFNKTGNKEGKTNRPSQSLTESGRQKPDGVRQALAAH